jgi:hypothetical protein
VASTSPWFLAVPGVYSAFYLANLCDEQKKIAYLDEEQVIDPSASYEKNCRLRVEAVQHVFAWQIFGSVAGFGLATFFILLVQ